MMDILELLQHEEACKAIGDQEDPAVNELVHETTSWGMGAADGTPTGKA